MSNRYSPVRALVPALALIAVMLCPSSANPTVACVPLAKILRETGYIVIGRLDSVRAIHGRRIATVIVEKTIHGPPLSRVHYFAEPSWTCDTSGAYRIGERALYLFYHQAVSPCGGATLHYFLNAIAGLPGAEAAVAEYHRDCTYSAFFASISTAPILLLQHSGRGRLPIRTLRGQEVVDVWTCDIILPPELRALRGPYTNSKWIKSTRLDQLLRYIRISQKADSTRPPYSPPEQLTPKR